MLKKEKFQLFIHDQPMEQPTVHSEIEILYVLEGSVNAKVDQKEVLLGAEDILVINANKRHTIKAVDNPLILRLLIDHMMVRDAFGGQEVIFWCNSAGSESERYDEMRRAMKRLLKHYVEADNYEGSFGFLADCYEIMNLLTANFMVKAADIQTGDDGDRYEERLEQINNYINSNYDQPISMKELSEKLYLSNGYLSRFFKKNYGTSFANYLTNVRLLHAADELLYTDVPVTRVAYDCGFTSAALFNKVFKKTHGVTPTEFRKRANAMDRENAGRQMTKPVEKRVEQNVRREEFVDEADELQGTAKVSEGIYFADQPVLCEPFWGDTINFGSASNLLHSTMREHLMILQRALGFKYVRFWSIFTPEFYIRPEQEFYDFSQIDSVLDFVQEQGMKPYIELGLKPHTIHYEAGNSMKQSAGEEFTEEQWNRLLHAFMRHLSMRYGQHVLDDWRMELWFDETYRNDEKNWGQYFTRFENTWRAIKECNEHIMFGGYGIRMDAGAEQRLRFLKQWAERPCRPDFISVMYYAYERDESGIDAYAKRSTDNQNFIHSLSKEKQRLAEAGFGDLPVYVCEWNFTPSVRNIMNDTTFKGAYIIKNVIDVYGLVSSMGYGAGSDRMYAYYDTPDMLFGGTGLITKEAILKPSAFALDFLNKLFPYFIGKQENFLITTDRHNNYSIICHNQQVLNYNYYLTSETLIERESTWKYFEDRKNLKVHILLKNVKEGQYRVKIYRISSRHGSVLDIWSEMGYDNELSRNDIKYLRRICEPNLTIRKVNTEENNLIVENELLPNEICLIRVRYIG